MVNLLPHLHQRPMRIAHNMARLQCLEKTIRSYLRYLIAIGRNQAHARANQRGLIDRSDLHALLGHGTEWIPSAVEQHRVQIYG